VECEDRLLDPDFRPEQQDSYPVFWIRDILVRIRMRIRILLFLSVIFKLPTKIYFFYSKFLISFLF